MNGAWNASDENVGLNARISRGRMVTYHFKEDLAEVRCLAFGHYKTVFKLIEQSFVKVPDEDYVREDAFQLSTEANE